MDAQINILAIGTHRQIMATLAHIINKHENWKATLAFNSNEALELLSSHSFQIVLICSGVADEETLSKKIMDLYPQLPLVKHYGGGSGLILAEIYGALNRQ